MKRSIRDVRFQTRLKWYLSASPNESTPDANLISTSSVTIPLTRPEGWYIDRFHRSLSLSTRVRANHLCYFAFAFAFVLVC